MTDETTFTLEQALAAQQALRALLGMKPEIFPVQAFVGMISDEIELSRKDGRDDRTIVDLIYRTTGKLITVEQLQAFYATPGQLFRRGGERS